jgi:hypothetical protein
VTPPTGLEWPVWRLIARGLATLAELETNWSMADLGQALDYLDYLDETETVARMNAAADTDPKRRR